MHFFWVWVVSEDVRNHNRVDTKIYRELATVPRSLNVDDLYPPTDRSSKCSSRADKAITSKRRSQVIPKRLF
jgi:hypothetical protein